MAHTLTLENGTVIELAPLMLTLTATFNDNAIGDETPIDFWSLPLASQIGLVSRGKRAVMSNETSSALNGKIKAKVIEGTERKAADVDAAEIKAYREANADACATMLTAIVAEYRDKITSGELGSSTRGEGMSLETKIERAAIERLLEQLFAKIGQTLPTGKGSRDARNALVDDWYTDAYTKTRAVHDRAYQRILTTVRAEMTPKPNVVKATSLAALMPDDDAAAAQ